MTNDVSHPKTHKTVREKRPEFTIYHPKGRFVFAVPFVCIQS